MTQTDLAEKVSVSRQTIYAIEIGKYVHSVELVLRISKMLGVRVEEIFKL